MGIESFKGSDCSAKILNCSVHPANHKSSSNFWKLSGAVFPWLLL